MASSKVNLARKSNLTIRTQYILNYFKQITRQVSNYKLHASFSHYQTNYGPLRGRICSLREACLVFKRIGGILMWLLEMKYNFSKLTTTTENLFMFCKRKGKEKHLFDFDSIINDRQNEKTKKSFKYAVFSNPL